MSRQTTGIVPDGTGAWEMGRHIVAGLEGHLVIRVAALIALRIAKTILARATTMITPPLVCELHPMAGWLELTFNYC